MRKLVVFLLILTGLSWGFAASAASTVSVILMGQTHDISFSDSIMPGIDRARQELGVSVQVLEARYDPSQYPLLVEHAARTSRLVIAVGWPLQKAVENAAPRYPSVHFVLFDAYAQRPDVTSVIFRQNESSYLAGALAAHMSLRTWDSKIRWDRKSGRPPVIGAVVGDDFPATRDFLAGYHQGARAVREDIEILVDYCGSWDDPEKARELARQQHEQGADVIFQLCGPAGMGVIEAGIEEEFYVIGVDSPQERIAPGVVLTSALKRLDVAVWNVISAFREGRLRRGSLIVCGLKENGVDLSWTSNALIPGGVKSRLDILKNQIIAGEITVDSAFSEPPSH